MCYSPQQFEVNTACNEALSTGRKSVEDLRCILHAKGWIGFNTKITKYLKQAMSADVRSVFLVKSDPNWVEGTCSKATVWASYEGERNRIRAERNALKVELEQVRAAIKLLMSS